MNSINTSELVFCTECGCSTHPDWITETGACKSCAGDLLPEKCSLCGHPFLPNEWVEEAAQGVTHAVCWMRVFEPTMDDESWAILHANAPYDRSEVVRLPEDYKPGDRIRLRV